jgi:circadian clock protein KaiB
VNAPLNKPAVFKFCLYVAGDALNSVQARVNLTALCNTHFANRHEIEIVDVFRDPQRALADGIFMTPMLIKVAPRPICRIVGTLSNTSTVLHALDVGVGPMAA